MNENLIQIDGETVEAQIKANETASKVDALFDQLNQLQKNVLKNEFDAKAIKEQSELVREAANKAHDGAINVRRHGNFNFIKYFLIYSLSINGKIFLSATKQLSTSE